MPTEATVLDSFRILLVGTTEWVEEFEVTLRTRTDAAVRSVATVERAMNVVRAGEADCVVSEHRLVESSGLALLRSIRAETDTLPVVLCTAEGSEGLASEAITAGVSEYVPLEGPKDESIEELLASVERSIRAARRSGMQRDRARQFDAIFHDSRTATWVLDPDGRVERANETGREMVSHDGDRVVDSPFWGLWGAGNGRLRGDVRRVVETAFAGSFGNAVITRAGAVGDGQVIDLSARPVSDARGEIVAIVVEGVDVTERVTLERDLRRSEELHRVTLNNMTDTVLMTDESGEYTYICPNVNFIFGYTAAEIREIGTIDALLGEDLFDREKLAERGVLKNIECTATDKAGREHTLLVNVREVSIQDGTVLYSCRDITKRKQREEALATLQEMARDFLYAETHQEIARHVVEDTPGVLDLNASAVYLFDSQENELRPAATSPRMEEVNGPLPAVRANAEGLTSHSFVEDEALFFDDVHDAPKLTNRATALRSAAYIPLGDHGVFLAGADAADEFDDVTRELADLLAATAEAALDRVTRETRLRRQDRELQRQNDQLTALNRINGTIREIDQALVEAETREEIDHTVCELLTADDRFSFAWVGAPDRGGETVEPRAWAGDEQGYLDSLDFPVDASNAEPSGRTAATGDVTMVSNVTEALRDEAWRKNALSRDYLSALSIPLGYNELSYGVLTVYAQTQNAFDDTSRAVLAELGETIAAAISAIERKNALLTTSMTRLEFTVDDPTFVLSRIAREVECTLSYQGGVQQTVDGSYVFVTAEGATVDRIREVTTDLVAVDEVQPVSDDGTTVTVRLGLTQPFLALELADHGAVFKSASADPSTTTLVVEIPESIDARNIAELVRDLFTDVELRSKRRFDRSSTGALDSRVFDELTDRQIEVTQTAYYSGFFESPRENTGREVADMLDISSAAFSKHMRAVQRTLFSTLFEERGVPRPGTDAGGVRM